MEIIIKLDHDEPVKVTTASTYGEQHPLPYWDPEALRAEIQDLKLENDRLKQRDEIMTHFLRSVRCKGLFCDKCDLDGDHGCYWTNDPSCKGMWDMIDNVFMKLEALE